MTAGALCASAAAVLPTPASAVDEGRLPDRIILNPTPTPAVSQHVTWRTDKAVEGGTVEYRAAGGAVLSEEAVDPQSAARHIDTGAHHHSATLTGLAPDTRYDYRVGTDEGWSDWYSFTTATDGAATSPWTFLYFGDAQNGLGDAWPPVVDEAFAQYPEAELTLHAGDQINDAHEDAQWGQWFAGLGEHLAETQTLTTLGNHELTVDLTASQYRAHHEYPRHGPLLDRELVWYTDYQDVRFISLNGNAPTGSLLGQTPWLRDKLANNPSKWTVVFFHHPMFSATDGRDNLATRHAWLPLLEKHDVDLVLQGHDHAYARGHLTENERPDGTVAGPVYTVAVGGSKYYDLSPADDNNWTDNRATRAVAYGETSTFQAITVTDDVLTYRSVVGARGAASDAPGERGSTLDAFTIVKDDDGEKRVVDGLASTVTATTSPVGHGAPARVRASVTSLGRPVTQGRVRVSADGRVLATAPVGSALRVPTKALGAGPHRLRVDYLGAAEHLPARTTLGLRVRKARPVLTATARRTGATRGVAGVRLRGLAHRATGSVTVHRRADAGWVRVGRAVLSGAGSEAEVPLRRLPTTATVLRVRYSGDADTATRTVRVRLPRR